MQFTWKFTALSCSIFLALTSVVFASPTADGVVVDASENTVPTYLVTHNEMLRWLATTDAELTFVGKPINPLASRNAENTIVTYCTKRAANVCGGTCIVYNGGATCIRAPGTNCLAATHNVGFCDGSACNHSCNQLSTCGTRLDNSFCYTPGTNSIIVSAA